ncbi:MAG: DUF1580 domain-containing protein [Candidatus Hydrogenedentes bacterium]|nr:DUF1580 domain-containing protein [Candidatus Hydrogenedentota bacterium]
MIAEHLTLTNAAKQCPGRPSVNAVWRWCRKGVRSRNGEIIRLDHIRVGGRIFTSAEALNKFFSAVARADALHFNRAYLGMPTQKICNPAEDMQERVARANKLLEQTGF